jgi:tRNA-dihydrouridine synthase
MTGMVRLGKLNLDAPFYQAGLAGYSDAAMRRVARRHGCPYCVTEAMLDQFLLAGGKGLKHAELHDDDHPIAGQLMGSHAADIAAAAKILVQLGYDVIDVNLACPVKKIRRRSRGGHLLQLPDEAVAILAAVRQAVPPHVPCTVKLRRGTDDSVQAERNFHRIFVAALELGYAGATVHGRTVEQKYLGPAQWNFLRRLVDDYGLAAGGPGFADQGSGQGQNSGVRRPGTGDRDWQSAISNQQSAISPQPRSPLPAPHTPAASAAFTLAGSGDIWTAADIFRMIRATGVHWVSVARGCIGNPWLFTQARALLRGQPEADAMKPPTIHQQRAVLLEHFELSVELHGEKMAGMMMRKFGIKFARHHPDAPAVKAGFIAARGLIDWQRVLDAHYATDGPGAEGAAAENPPQGDCVCDMAELS